MATGRAFRLSALRRRTKILLALLLTTTVLIALFDWNWLRRPLECYLSHESGREVRIGELHVALGLNLQPTVRVRDVYIENAPWAAAKRPFATAGEARFTVSLRTVLGERVVISRIVLVDADVDMEREADGRRNWRLRDPENRGPGRVRVLALEAHGTQIRFVNRAIDLDLVAAASPHESRDDNGLSTRITFEGRYRGEKYSGVALSGPILTFRESGLAFPVRGHFVTRGTRLEVDGTFMDIFDPGPIDAKLRIAGPSLAQVYPFLRIRPPESRPYAVDMRVTQARDVFRFTQIKGRIGSTSGTGDVTLDRSGKRPSVQAVLHTDAGHLEDVLPVFGLPSPVERIRKTAVSGTPRDAPQNADNGGDKRPLPVKAIKSFDVRIAATAEKLTLMDFSTLENVRVDANLREGLLEIKPIDFRMAGGRGAGSITFDVREATASAMVSAELRGVRIDRLAPALAVKQHATAAVNVRMKLGSRGSSASELIDSTRGSFVATVDAGRISNLADAKLGLNFGKIVGLFLRGDRDIAINCATLAFDVRDGVAHAREIELDTEQTYFHGTGTVKLREQGLDVVLTPEPKKLALFRRDASIRIGGTLWSPAVSIVDRVEKRDSTRKARC